MSGYVIAGYGVTVVTLGAYALHVLRRGRSLARSASQESQEEHGWG